MKKHENVTHRESARQKIARGREAPSSPPNLAALARIRPCCMRIVHRENDEWANPVSGFEPTRAELRLIACEYYYQLESELEMYELTGGTETRFNVSVNHRLAKIVDALGDEALEEALDALYRTWDKAIAYRDEAIRTHNEWRKRKEREDHE